WSPDGKRLAYISDATGAFHLHVMDLLRRGLPRVLGGADNDINYGSDALWTPDGKYISISGSVYALSGGKIAPGLATKAPVRFSPDGRLVYGYDSAKL